MKLKDYLNCDITFFQTCLICNKKITNVTDKHFASGELTKHLKKHGYTFREYLMKIIEDYPCCECGCGQPKQLNGTRFRQYNSGHKDLLNYKNMENKKKLSINNKKLKYNTNLLIAKHNLTIGDLFEAFNLYKNPELTFPDIAKQYNLDPRTLKSYLLKLNICTKEEFYNLSIEHKYALKYQCEKNKCKIEIPENILENIFKKILILYQNK